MWTGVVQSVMRLAMGWTVRGSKPIPVAERSKVRVCGQSFSGVAGSNPAGGHGRLCCVCCTVRTKSKSQDKQDKELRVKCKERTKKKIPGEGEIFRTRPNRPWDPPRLFFYVGYRVSFPGVKLPGRGVNHSPHLAPRLKKG